ncbi:MAG TPA: hypothetical protein DDY37_01145 [Legionella sp.]|nr:hypothetical protein [Legionella sp.]
MKTIQTIVITGLTLGGSFAQAANVTQINRYATVANQPLASQVNPLLTVQQMHFPQTVSNVGDAIVYWLQYSGFKLADESRLLPVFKVLMTQPLPQVDRNFGPLTIQDGLVVLAGQQEFTLVQNPLTRTVNFKLKRQGHSV